jgi:nitrile hydratase subunit beta
MNGLHDLGGMHGFGPVIPEPETPVFHEDWQKRALALTLAMAGWGKWSIDESRHARETLPPKDMVSLSYYERWIAALTDLILRHGLVSEAELSRAAPDAGSQPATPPLPAARVAAVLAKGGPTSRALDRQPRFKPGDRVRARNINPEGHTRLPRYARGKLGEVVLYHGGHVFADASAHQPNSPAEPLYAVRFTARELWGEAADAKHSVTLDLWEPHLDPA